MKIKFAVVILFCITCLAGCGKLSAPEPVPGSGYPHTYPHR